MTYVIHAYPVFPRSYVVEVWSLFVKLPAKEVTSFETTNRVKAEGVLEYLTDYYNAERVRNTLNGDPFRDGEFREDTRAIGVKPPAI